ncbi:MAG: ABC transporter permease [Phycisphaerae bacterium]|nr:ABC transporter permease [Phycisphaerae bacterium]
MFALWIESCRMALRELRRHKTRSVLTAVGIIIGVAAVIITVSVVQGAKKSIEGDIAKQGKNMIIVIGRASTRGTVRGGGGGLYTNMTVDDARAIEEECDAVAYACATHRFEFQAVTNVANWKVPVTGVGPNYTTIRTWDVVAGRDLEPRDIALSNKVCLIGQTAARELFGARDPINEVVRVAGVPLKIVGLLAAKGVNPLGQDEDNTLVVPLNVLLRQMLGVDRPGGILCSARSDDLVEDAVAQITSLLRQRHRLGSSDEDDFDVTSLKEKIELARNTSNIMTLLMVCIAAVSLVVGGIGIMNIMLVAVSERTREIGIRMAIGATTGAINRQFLIEAAVISTAGGLIGIVIGIANAIVIASGFGWEAQMPLWLVGGSFLFSTAIGVFFGWLPAKRAADLNPIEALRHD